VPGCAHFGHGMRTSFIGNPPVIEEQSNSTATLAETIRWFLYVRELTRCVPLGGFRKNWSRHGDHRKTRRAVWRVNSMLHSSHQHTTASVRRATRLIRGDCQTGQYTAGSGTVVGGDGALSEALDRRRSGGWRRFRMARKCRRPSRPCHHQQM